MYGWNTYSFCIIGAAWIWLCCELGTDLYFRAALFELMKPKLSGSLKFTTIEKPIFKKKKKAGSKRNKLSEYELLQMLAATEVGDCLKDDTWTGAAETKD